MRKHFFIFLTFVILLICSCKSINKPYTEMFETQMMNEYEQVFTQWQLDSICDVDGISHDLNVWYQAAMKDYETKENVTQYFYIHSLGEYECIYRVQKLENGTYKITKRITK